MIVDLRLEITVRAITAISKAGRLEAGDKAPRIMPEPRGARFQPARVPLPTSPNPVARAFSPPPTPYVYSRSSVM